MTQTSNTNFATEQEVGFIKVTRGRLPPLLGRHYDNILFICQNRIVINNFSKFQ